MKSIACPIFLFSLLERIRLRPPGGPGAVLLPSPSFLSQSKGTTYITSQSWNPLQNIRELNRDELPIPFNFFSRVTLLYSTHQEIFSPNFLLLEFWMSFLTVWQFPHAFFSPLFKESQTSVCQHCWLLHHLHLNQRDFPFVPTNIFFFKNSKSEIPH